MAIFRGRVVKLISKIDKTISFQGEANGKAFGKISGLKSLEAKKSYAVNKSKFLQFCHQQRQDFRIRVLLEDKPTGLYLKPIELLNNNIRIVFEYKIMVDGSQVLGGSREHLSGQTTELRLLGLEDIGEMPMEETHCRRAVIPNHQATPNTGGYETSSHVNVLDDSPDFPTILQQLGDTANISSSESITQSNQVKANYLALKYHTPSNIRGMQVANILSSDVQLWEHAIVGYYVMDNTQNIDVKEYVSKEWESLGSFKTYDLQAEGFFLFNFKSEADKYKVLQQGQWFINNRPLILKTWVPNLLLDPFYFLATVPIWVKFPNLNLQFMSDSALSKIASLIGKPLFADEATSRNERLQYARVCIEIKVGAKLPEKVPILMDGEMMNISVEYEWTPQPCKGCCSLAHDSSAWAPAEDTFPGLMHIELDSSHPLEAEIDKGTQCEEDDYLASFMLNLERYGSVDWLSVYGMIKHMVFTLIKKRFLGWVFFKTR